MALVLALALSLLVAALAAGMLAVSASQALTAAAVDEWERARLAVESAAADAFAAWVSAEHARRPIGASWVVSRERDPSGARTTVYGERLGPGLFMLRADRIPEGRPGAVARVALLVRAISPDEILASFPAAVTSSGAVVVEADGLVESVTPAPWDPGRLPDCAEARASLDTLFGGPHPPAILARQGAPVTLHGSVRGEPPLRRVTGLPAPPDTGLGPIPWARVSRLADRSGPALLRPADGCAPPMSGHGATGRRDGPAVTAETFLIHAPDLHLCAGAVRGILAVDGDVVLEDGATVFGAVFARGSVEIRDSATVQGAVRAGGAITVGAGGAVRYDACAVWTAVTGSPALNRAYRPGNRWWIPDFVGGT